MIIPVIKVARKGFDAETADSKNLTVYSAKNQLKLFKRISVTTDDPI